VRLLGQVKEHFEGLARMEGDVPVVECECGRIFHGDHGRSSVEPWLDHQERMLLDWLKTAQIDIVNGVICCGKCATMGGHRPGCVNE